MRDSDHRLFLQHWLRSPLSMGALLPSGSPLARLMAAQIDPAGGPVVELGAGTGAITRALLACGLPPDRLLVVERNPVFARLLQDRFPGVHIVQGDASQTERLMIAAGLGPAQTIISSLPLLALPARVQHDILRSSLAVLGPAGCFIQFTYGLVSPITPELRQVLDLQGRRVATVWRNLPPARIWRYTRPRPGISQRLAA